MKEAGACRKVRLTLRRNSIKSHVNIYWDKTGLNKGRGFIRLKKGHNDIIVPTGWFSVNSKKAMRWNNSQNEW